MTDNLSHLLAARASQAPRAPFVALPGGEVVTYADLAAAAAQAGHALTQLGVKPGDRITAQIPKCMDALSLYFGAMRAGAIYVPLNTAYTTSELAYFIADSAPALMVCTPQLRQQITDAAGPGLGRVETFDRNGDGSLQKHIASCEKSFSGVPCSGGDVAAILYTSGTTGRSKGAMLTHANLISNALTLADLWRFSATDRVLHALPLYHTHGLFTATNTVMAAGASMLLLDAFDSGEVIDQLPHATVFMGVPTYYTRLLANRRLDGVRLEAMRLFISGSAPLSPDIHAQFTRRTGHVILERYGMTETNMNTSNPYEGERRPGSVGRPLPGVELRISALTTGRPVREGGVGVIEVRGPNVFKGYWRENELTRKEFRSDGFFITGDLGRIDAQGYVWIEGREKDLIISGGLNVYPAEIEAVIDAIAGVNESAVIGLPHPDFGEGVTAVVACDPAAGLDASAITAALAGALAKFKHPKRIFFVVALPRNAMGKIRKKELRERYSDTYVKA